MRGATRVMLGVSLALLCGACDSDYGYLEIRTNYQIRPGDIYMSGETKLEANADGQLDTLIRAAVGKNDIYVRRGASKIALCSVAIRKNRIVSVTINRGQSSACEVAA
jgi:hypothetical protein